MTPAQAHAMTAECPDVAEPPSVVVIGVTLLLLVLTGLFIYKWGGSIRTIHAVQATSQFGRSADPLTQAPALQATCNYFRIIWPALMYGMLIGALLRTSISPRRVMALLGGGFRSTLAGSVAGAPLMLCSCCITPVFTGIYERGSRLGPALALMTASPGLNLAALTLTCLLFPLPLALARVVAALAIVLGLSTLVGETLGSTVPLTRVPSAAVEAQLRGGFLARFLGNLWYMAKVTLPLMAAGVFLSILLMPMALQVSGLGRILVVLAISILAVPLALPTFFEIPLALVLSAVSPGAAVALLVAGPIINLPSLLVLARATSARVALWLAGGVAVVATVAGLAVSF